MVLGSIFKTAISLSGSTPVTTIRSIVVRSQKLIIIIVYVLVSTSEIYKNNWEPKQSFEASNIVIIINMPISAVSN